MLATAVLHARTSGVEAEQDSVLYVRSGAVVSRLSLSFDAIASDLYWMRAIQHDGRERQAGRAEPQFALLEPLVSLAVALDPQFNVAYRFGAILLAEEPPNGPGRPDQAIGLLERGLAANPERWQYAQDIGFVHYFHTGRFDEAARWFTRAADMPGAPRWLGPVAAITLARGGDRQGARTLLVELAATSDGYVKRSAERGLAQLQALDDLDRLRTLLSGHAARTGAYPNGLSDLDGAPLADPSGRSYVYDRTRGIAGLAPDSPLSPLPRTLDRR
jgi:tetratricopeptide (TPR) repeat protein